MVPVSERRHTVHVSSDPLPVMKRPGEQYIIIDMH
jgi:hypothetical protein